jgi:uncharacterized DUF497 family protein
MLIEFDPAKRDWTLRERGLDFLDAGQVFDGASLTVADTRYDYPEERFQTFGLVGDRLAIVVWTPIPDGVRVISMRKCNDREKSRFAARMG